MPRILRRPPARRDLIEHFVHIGEAAGEKSGWQFLESVDSSLEELSRMPLMGVVRQFRNQKFADIRMWRVKGFEKYLIFYRPLPDGIQVLRVVHGARDIDSLFK